MGPLFQQHGSKRRRWATASMVLVGLFTTYASFTFLLRYFDIGQVLALVSFLFLEILVILSVSRMPHTFEESGAYPGDEN